MSLLLTMASEFSPSDISGLTWWLDAADASTFTLTSTSVDEWRDKSGNARHVAAIAAINKPVLTQNVQNGLPAVRFGNSSALRGVGWHLNNIFGTAGHTIFIVARMRSMAGSGTTTSNPGLIAAEGNFWGIYTRNTYQLQSSIWNGSAQVAASSNADIVDMQILVDQHTGSAQTFGRAGATAGSASLTTAGLSTNRLINLGRNVNSSYTDCDIAEIICYNRSLTSSEKAQVQEYLRVKYNCYVGEQPDSITSLAGWWDAKNTNAITQSSNNVSAWASRVINAYSISNATGLTQPTYEAKGYLGNPCINFSTGDFLKITNSAFKAYTAMTVIAVLAPNAASFTSPNYSTYGIIAGLGRLGGNYVQFGGGVLGATALETFSVGNATNGLGCTNLYNSWAAGQPFIQAVTTGSGGTKVYRETHEISMTLENSATPATDFSPVARGVTNDELIIGGIASSDVAQTANANYKLAGLLIYSKVLSADELAQDMAYLQWRYGNGVQVAHLLGMTGQSNMDAQGLQAEAPVEYQSAQTGVLTFIKGVTTGGVAPLTTANSGSVTERFGPDISFAVDYYASVGVPCITVKTAIGGSSMAVEWNPAGAGGSALQEFEEKMDLALAVVRGAGYIPVLKLITDCQGEADVVSDNPANAYEQRKRDLVARLTARYGAFTWISIKTSPAIDDGTQANIDTVRAAQQAVALEVGGHYVETTGLPLKVDQTHFTTASIIANGKAAAVAYLTSTNPDAVNYL